MCYGIIKQLLLYKNCNDRILIENVFKETTRNGKEILNYVQLALTPTTFIIGSQTVLSKPYFLHNDNLHELSFYPLDSMDLRIFKKSTRNSIKVWIDGLEIRYFELESTCKRKTFWRIWNMYISELNKETKIWPFSGFNVTNKLLDPTCKKLILQHYPLRWIDKHLYLGEKRQIDDQHRPIPVAGLGSTEYIKLNLKPQYFGFWTQSDHWVQCE